MTYEIRNVRTNEKIAGPYDWMSSANRSFRSRLLTPETAYIADLNWRERERNRKGLINVEEFGLTAIPDHFLHVSPKSTYDQFLVSYTENEIKGSKDLQKSGQKIGRYLEEFYPGIDIRAIGAAIQTKMQGTGYALATDRKEIAAIYMEGEQQGTAGSCMSHRLDTYISGQSPEKIHPTEAYGSGEIGLAYLRDHYGTIIARTVVNLKAKRYTRSIYGTHPTKLEVLLRADGYLGGSLSGAKLLKLPFTYHDSRHEYFAVPYIDSARYVLDRGDHFMITDDGYAEGVIGSSSNGYVSIRVQRCAVTGEKLTSIEASRICDPNTGEELFIKASIRDEHCFYWNYGNQYYLKTGREQHYGRMPTYRNRSTRRSETIKPTDLVPVFLMQHHYYYVRDDAAPEGEILYYHPDELMEVYYAKRSKTKRVNQKAFFTDYGYCERSRLAYPRSELIWMEHNAWWHTDYQKEVTVVDGKNYATILVEERKIA